MQPTASRWEIGKSSCTLKTIQSFELAAFMTFYKLLMGTQVHRQFGLGLIRTGIRGVGRRKEKCNYTS